RARLLEHFQRGCTFSGEITCQGTTSVVPKRLDENQFLAAAGRRGAKRSAQNNRFSAASSSRALRYEGNGLSAAVSCRYTISGTALNYNFLPPPRFDGVSPTEGVLLPPSMRGIEGAVLEWEDLALLPSYKNYCIQT